MVQWLRFRAPDTGAWVWHLVRELDPTCCNKDSAWASLVAQCGGESLPAMQEMPVLSLVWEDPTFYGVTGPLRCDC